MKMLARLAAAFAVLAATNAVAQEYPSGPVTVIVPFGAGGGADSVMRAMQNRFGEILGGDVVVRNVAGAGGTVGAAEVAAASADGQTLGFLPIAPATTQPHLRNLPYDIDSWEFVCRVTNSPVFLLTSKETGLDSVEAVVEAAQAEPGKLAYGTPAPGSVPHLVMMAANGALGTEMKHVPHQGSAEVFRSLAGGVVQFYANIPVDIERGDLQPLAVFASERYAGYPDVPTMAELGHDLEFSIWYGMFAPSGTPDAVIQQLSDACGETVASDEFQAFIDRIKSDAQYLPSAEFETFVRSEYDKNGAILKSADF